MSVRSPLLHKPGFRIDWAQPHSMCKALDGQIWFAEPHFGPAASNPAPRQIWINQQCLVNEGSAITELFGDIGERMSGVTEYGRIVLTQLHSTSGQPSSFGNFLLSVDDPARDLASAKTQCGCGMHRSKIRIKLNSFVIQTERLVSALPGPFVNTYQSAQI